MTKVRDLMTPGVATTQESASVVEAARLMREHDIGALPVMDNGHLVGVVTDRDLAMRVIADGRDPGTTHVGDVASHELVAVSPDESLDDARQRMAARQVRRLVVLDEEGRLVGMLAQADIALEDGGRKTGRLVEEVSQPTSERG